MHEDYTLERLLEMRAKWWIRAIESGKVGAIRFIILWLGDTDDRYPSDTGRVIQHGELCIHGSLIGRSWDVKYKDRLVAGEWEEFSLWVPGPWETQLDELHDLAQAKQREQIRTTDEAERQRLIHELWLDTRMEEPQPLNTSRRA